MNYKVKKVDWYHFDHDRVNKQFSGGLTFRNYFCVNDEYRPVAVYHVKNPDKSKGHKKYMLLQLEPHGGGLVRGMSAQEISKYRYQTALVCLKCNTLVYSIMRHHMEACDCGEVKIDGGKDYTKVNYEEGAKYKMVTFDLLTDKIKNSKGL